MLNFECLQDETGVVLLGGVSKVWKVESLGVLGLVTEAF
jgi:hypothetical protein